MNKRLFLILLPALLSATGCKQQKASETKGTITEVEAHHRFRRNTQHIMTNPSRPAVSILKKPLADSVPVT